MKRKMSKSLLMTALITGLCIGGGQHAFAAEALQEFTLDPMVVTATRTEKNLMKVPASVNVVTAQEIKERNVQSIKDALKDLPGVYIDPYDQAYGGIQMRGFGGDNILVLYDGQPINNGWNGDINWDTIPVEQVERIEVVKGAASSLYGGRAVGGVINIISKDISDKKFSGNAVISYGSNNTWKKAIDVQGKVNEKLSFAAGFEQRKTDGIAGTRVREKTVTKTSSGSVTVPETSMDGYRYIVGTRGNRVNESENFNVSLKYNFDDSKSLKYAFTRSEHEYRYENPVSYVKDQNGNTVWSNGTYTAQDGGKFTFSLDDFLSNNAERETNLHILSYNDVENLFVVNLGMQDVKRDGYGGADGADSLDYIGEGTFTAYPSKNYNFDIQKTWENVGKHNLTVGANWKEENMWYYKYTCDRWDDLSTMHSPKLSSKGRTESMAAFVQDEYKFDDKYTMYLGGRFDYYKKADGWNDYSKDVPEESFTEFSPKVAFEYNPDDTTTYYASYGHSFSAPRMYYMFRASGSALANPDMKPETSDTLEIGVKKKFDDTMVSVSAFKIDTEDAIYSKKVYDPIDNKDKTKYLNGNAAEKKGFELDVRHKFNDKLGGYINYTWQDGEVEDTLGMVQTNNNIPKHLLHFGLDYNIGKFNAVLDAQYVSERQAEDDVTGEYGSEDAFFVMNTYFNYKLTPEATLQFGIDNVLDREYYAGECTRGRTYNVSLRYSF